MTIASKVLKPAWLFQQAVILPTLQEVTNGLLHGKNVLDIACNNGETTHQLINWGAKYAFAFDKDEEIIHKAKKRWSHVKEIDFHVENMMSYKNVNAYDVITAINAFCYLDTKKKLGVSIKNAYDSLKDDGVLIAMVPNGIKDLNPLQKDAFRLGVGLKMSPEAWRDEMATMMVFYIGDQLVKQERVFFYFRETYQHLLESAGFKKVEWITPIISSEEKIKYGDSYFHHYITPPKDIVFRAFKQWKD